MSVLGAALSVAVTVKGVTKISEELYQLGKAKFGDQVKRLRNESTLKKLAKSIANIQDVKTLLQIDKEVHLESIYYPSKVMIEGRDHIIESMDSFPEKRNLILEGTVGQGKSIFLRFLALQEIRKRERIPIFFELRKIEGFDGLLSALRSNLTSLGFELTPDLFEFYCKSGKFAFFLDGFDEIPAGKVSQVLLDLETLCISYPETQIVVTSRQAGGLESSVHFRVFPLAKLKQQDFDPFLEKIFGDRQQIDLLLKAIQKSPNGLKDLLTTPLNLTLLVLVYKSEHFIPPSLAGFYSVLYQAIVGRHDRAKTGFTRPRKTKLSDRELEDAFRAFCFLSRQKGYASFDENKLHECATRAFEFTGLECDSAAFKEDIIRNTCFLVADAFEYKFVHSSIQEYYAAAFVKSGQIELAEKFYQRLRLNRVWASWAQEIFFLEEIDKYRYMKLFLLPELNDFIRPYEPSAKSRDVKSDWSYATDLMRGSRLFFAPAEKGYVCQNGYVGVSKAYGEREGRWMLFASMVRSGKLGFSTPINQHLDELLDGENANELGRIPVDLCKFAIHFKLQNEMVGALRDMISKLVNRMQNATKVLEQEDRKVTMIDII